VAVVVVDGMEAEVELEVTELLVLDHLHYKLVDFFYHLDLTL
jgi:hypothetical protein|tara:strand:- start:615 stop:740 length:126 start_codon:yes stop_codon:yes gene_type:complete